MSNPPSEGSRLLAASLVVGSIVSIQFGTALATDLFDRVGIFGAVLLRTLLAAVLLVAIWRPTVGLFRQAPLLIFAFGFSLSAVTSFLYLSIDRIPLGAAVTIEFLGPLTVAVLTSRRRLDLLWVALAAFFYGKAFWEDRLLAEKHGVAWFDYADHVSGFVPRFWGSR